MKRFITVTFIIFIAIYASAAINYKITGKTPAYMNGCKIYITLLSKQSSSPTDSTIVQNEHFELNGITDRVDIANIRTSMIKNGNTSTFTTLSVVIGEKPVIIDFTGSIIKFEGGELNKLLTEYNNIYRKYGKKEAECGIDKLYEEYDAPTTTLERKTEIKKSIDLFYKGQNEEIKKLVSNNLNNIVGAYIFASKAPYIYSETERNETYKKASSIFQKYPLVQSMLSQVKVSSSTLAGNKYKDFQLPDTNGTLQKLSNSVSKNRYVLLDFWASWCGPCRSEMPMLKSIYEKYHAQGFEIVSISLDSKKEDWLKAIKDLQINWHQWSDLKGWNSEAAKKYGVSSIPCTILIRSDGVIISRNLRGEKLANQISSLFKESNSKTN